MRILGIEPSSVILCQTKYDTNFKYDAKMPNTLSF